MGKTMITYPRAIGENTSNFSYNHFEFIKNKNIGETTLVKTTDNFFDSFDYPIWKCGKTSFTKTEKRKLHSNYVVVGKGESDEDISDLQKLSGNRWFV